jgi:hypothetical protein
MQRLTSTEQQPLQHITPADLPFADAEKGHRELRNGNSGKKPAMERLRDGRSKTSPRHCKRRYIHWHSTLGFKHPHFKVPSQLSWFDPNTLLKSSSCIKLAIEPLHPQTFA